jgi:hypothetical protein
MRSASALRSASAQTGSSASSKETAFAEDVTDPALLRDTLRWEQQEVGFIARQ